MPRIVDSIALDSPASDPNINETQTFTMDGTLTTSGSHAIDVNVHWEWDQGLGDSDANYADIPASSAALTIGGTNPENNYSNANLTAQTITGVTAGSYFVRIRTVDNNDSGAKDVSGTQAVTVNAASSGFGAALSDHRNQTILRH